MITRNTLILVYLYGFFCCGMLLDARQRACDINPPWGLSTGLLLVWPISLPALSMTLFMTKKEGLGCTIR